MSALTEDVRRRPISSPSPPISAYWAPVYVVAEPGTAPAAVAAPVEQRLQHPSRSMTTFPAVDPVDEPGSRPCQQLRQPEPEDYRSRLRAAASASTLQPIGRRPLVEPPPASEMPFAGGTAPVHSPFATGASTMNPVWHGNSPPGSQQQSMLHPAHPYPHQHRHHFPPVENFAVGNVRDDLCQSSAQGAPLHSQNAAVTSPTMPVNNSTVPMPPFPFQTGNVSNDVGTLPPRSFETDRRRRVPAELNVTSLLPANGIREPIPREDLNEYTTIMHAHKQASLTMNFAPSASNRNELKVSTRLPADEPSRTKQNIYISADSPANVSEDGRRRPPVTVSSDDRSAQSADRWRHLFDLLRADSRVRNSFLSMALLAVVSLFVGALAVQLLLRLTGSSTANRPSLTATSASSEGIAPLPVGDGGAVVTTSTSQRRSLRIGVDATDKVVRGIIEHIAIGLSAVVIVLDMCCLLTISVQCFLTVQLTRQNDGTQRAANFINRCNISRAVSAVSFVLSIPMYLLSLILHAILEFSFVPAIVCIAVFAVGALCATATASHSIHFWRQTATNWCSDPPTAPSRSSVQTTDCSSNNNNRATVAAAAAVMTSDFGQKSSQSKGKLSRKLSTLV